MQVISAALALILCGNAIAGREGRASMQPSGALAHLDFNGEQLFESGVRQSFQRRLDFPADLIVGLDQRYGL